MDFNHGVCVYGRQKLLEKQSTLNFKRLQGLHGTESSLFQGNNLNIESWEYMSKFQGCGGIFPEFSGRKPDFSLIFVGFPLQDRSGFLDHNLT